MKKTTLVLFIAAALMMSGFKKADDLKAVTLRVEYSFINIVEGYDHLNKTEVYIDGELAGTSTIRRESEENVVICTTSKGSHNVKVINYANIDGDVWEEHTLENEYSIDCKYESEVNLKKKNNKIVLLFDIESGTERTK